MKYIYAALLLHEAGKEINEENLKKIIEQVESPDEARIKVIVESLKGVNIDEVIKAPVAIEVKEEKKEVKEEKKEEKEEIAAEGLAALFG
jgi:large subunit ribosomal protein L12